jgi:peptidoglycan hydrolase CwlO-like protein
MAEESKDRTQLRAQVEELRERVKQSKNELKELQERLDDGTEPPPSKPS